MKMFTVVVHGHGQSVPQLVTHGFRELACQQHGLSKRLVVDHSFFVFRQLLGGSSEKTLDRIACRSQS